MSMISSLLVSWLFANLVLAQESELLHGDSSVSDLTILESVSSVTPHLEQPDYESDLLTAESFLESAQRVLTCETRGRVVPICISARDDVWLISARESHCSPADLSLLHCSRLRDGNWQSARLEDLTELHSTDKSKVTMMYVHGNRTELKWAKARGLQFYQNAFHTCQRPPIRFVIFAWRSETECPRAFVDFDIKSERSVTIGETFGNLLCQFEDRKMVIGGFSLGAQVVLTGLSGPDLQCRKHRPGKYRVAVFAPALNAQFIASELNCLPSSSNVHQTEVFLNRQDCAVKISRTIALRRANSETSLRDLDGAGAPNCNIISVRDITCEINRKHSVVNYGSSKSLNIKLAEMLNATLEDSRVNSESTGKSFDSLSILLGSDQSEESAEN